MPRRQPVTLKATAAAATAVACTLGPAPTLAAATTSLLLPLYSAPGTGGADWDSVTSALTANPNLSANIIINFSNGPGSSSVPDSDWQAGASALSSLPNVSLIGYVHSTRCTRDISEVQADINSWAGWVSDSDSSQQLLKGIFVDEAPNDGTCADYMSSLTDSINGAFSSDNGSAVTVFNPGFPATVGALDAYYDLNPSYIVALETCFTTTTDGEDLCDGDYTVYDSEGYGSTVDSVLADWVGEDRYGATAVLVHGVHGSNGFVDISGDKQGVLEGMTGALAERGVGAAGFVSEQWMTPGAEPADIASVAAAMAGF